MWSYLHECQKFWGHSACDALCSYFDESQKNETYLMLTILTLYQEYIVYFFALKSAEIKAVCSNSFFFSFFIVLRVSLTVVF